MSKKIEIVLAVILFIAILVYAKSISNKNNYDTIEKNDKIPSKIETDNMEEEITNKKVLIDFYATWCGPCKELSPILDEVAKENEDIELVRIDVDENVEMAEEYGIVYLPTLVVLEDGVEVERSIGLISKKEVLKLIGKK